MRRFAILLLIALFVDVGAQSEKPGTRSTQIGPRVPEFVKGYFREYALDHAGSGPAIVSVDNEDNVWVALAKTGKIARFANGAIDTFEIGAESRPVGLVAGSSANGHAGVIWIAASYDNKLIRFDAVSKQIREYKIEGENSWPFNVALGSDGSVWFTERAASKIGRLNPSTAEVRHYEVPTANSGPAGLAVDALSGRVWFTESYADRIGVLDPNSGTIYEYKMSDSSTGLVSGPAGLAVDAEGGVWFAKLEGKLGYIAPGSQRIDLIDIPREASRPAGITVTKNGEVWIAALDGNLLLLYSSAAKQFKLYPIPTGEADERPGTPPLAKTSRPFGITTDRQGNIWFSQQYTGQLAVLDIAAPELTISSPAGTVRTADVLLTMRALDRVAGVQHITVKLDGKQVPVNRGRLDLRESLPGQHKLEVLATDAAGFTTTAFSDFKYAPGPLALLDLLRQSIPTNKSGDTIKESLIVAAQDLTKGNIRAKLTGLRQKLRASAKLFKTSDTRALEAAIDFQLQNADQTVDIRILDQPPYFSPTEVVLRKGDTVRWKYDPPSDGHSVSHRLHRIEIQGTEIRSGMLRAGETFAYRFEQSGQFAIRDTENGAYGLIVKVLQ